MKTIEMSKTKETKGTVVFTEDGDGGGIPTLYIKKALVTELGNPDKIRITIDPVT